MDLKDLYMQIREDAMPLLVNVETGTSDNEWATQFSTKQLHLVRAPMPEPLELHTLKGLIDYLQYDAIHHQSPEADWCIHVEDVDKVLLCGSLNMRTKQRPVFVRATPFKVAHSFGVQNNAEYFVIWLQSCFVDEYDRPNVLAYAGNVVQKEEAGVSDDGVTQAVTVRTGITSKAVTALPNPVVLSPYRTFLEVEQPDSRFVFRAHDGLKFSLTEADGGAWRNVAIKRIAEWLATELKERGMEYVSIIA